MSNPIILGTQEVEALSRRFFESNIVYDQKTQHKRASNPELGIQAELSGYRFYKHLAVNFPNGTRLADFPRSTKVRIYATDIDWSFATSVDATITSPSGHGGAAPGDWRFPGMPHFGIVLYQDNGTRHSITGTSSVNAQVLDISNGHDLKFAINDRNGTYEDNSGAYSIFIEQVQS